MWPAEYAWRAPIGDFPPSWASAWGDDSYGLWADLAIDGISQRMRWIEPSGPEGFWMGAPQAERNAIKGNAVRGLANQYEHEPRCVAVLEGFWLADTPCTQALWQAVTGENPSHFQDQPDAFERPVEQVSWNDVMDKFIAGVIATPEWGTKDRLGLLTEDQWEYAARAGSRSAYWWGDTPDDARANWNRLHNGTTTVKRFAPNPWGLFDMHGNVWEWCADKWQPRLGARPDPKRRVLRGGTWFDLPGSARAAHRFRWECADANRYQGFRFAVRSPSGLETLGGGAGR